MEITNTNYALQEEINKEKTTIKHKSSNILFYKPNWKIKSQDRSRDRMKLVIKLTNEEAEAVNNFKKVVTPEGVSNLKEEDFLKMVFFMGLDTLNRRLNQSLVDHMEKNRAEYEAKGVKFDENGKVIEVPRNQAQESLAIPEPAKVEE